jgi:hypothetical protein
VHAPYRNASFAEAGDQMFGTVFRLFVFTRLARSAAIQIQGAHEKPAIALDLCVRDSIIRLVCDGFTLSKLEGRRKLIEDRKG